MKRTWKEALDGKEEWLERVKYINDFASVLPVTSKEEYKELRREINRRDLIVGIDEGAGFPDLEEMVPRYESYCLRLVSETMNQALVHGIPLFRKTSIVHLCGMHINDPRMVKTLSDMRQIYLFDCRIEVTDWTNLEEFTDVFYMDERCTVREKIVLPMIPEMDVDLDKCIVSANKGRWQQHAWNLYATQPVDEETEKVIARTPYHLTLFGVVGQKQLQINSIHGLRCNSLFVVRDETDARYKAYEQPISIADCRFLSDLRVMDGDFYMPFHDAASLRELRVRDAWAPFMNLCHDFTSLRLSTLEISLRDYPKTKCFRLVDIPYLDTLILDLAEKHSVVVSKNKYLENMDVTGTTRVTILENPMLTKVRVGVIDLQDPKHQVNSDIDELEFYEMDKEDAWCKARIHSGACIFI